MSLRTLMGGASTLLVFGFVLLACKSEGSTAPVADASVTGQPPPEDAGDNDGATSSGVPDANTNTTPATTVVASGSNPATGNGTMAIKNATITALSKVTEISVTSNVGGTVEHRLKVIFVNATGEVIDVAHDWGDIEATTSCGTTNSEGLACVGVTHDSASKTITLKATNLTGTFPVVCKSTLDGTITYP